MCNSANANIITDYMHCFKEGYSMNGLDVITEFREDHRRVRDGLIDMIQALKSKDVIKARTILGELNVLTGPHFRFEEEALYPALRVFLGEHVDQLVREHDTVIETARSCAELLKKDTLNDDEANRAAEAARNLLVHVTNCDGLSILTERLDKKEYENLGKNYAASRTKGVPLLEWAEKIRKQA